MRKIFLSIWTPKLYYIKIVLRKILIYFDAYVVTYRGDRENGLLSEHYLYILSHRTQSAERTLLRKPAV